MAIIIRSSAQDGQTQHLYTTSLDQRQLVVGLGNPGPKYHYNRHNLGFLCLDYLVQSYDGRWQEQTKLKAQVAQITIGSLAIIALKPMTFMNLSGQAVELALNFYKIEPKDLIVAHDAVESDWATIVWANGGGGRGHKGIASIQAKLDQDFWRCKVGIGPRPTDWDLTDFVLSDLSPGQQEKLPLIQREVSHLISSRPEPTKIDLRSLNGN